MAQALPKGIPTLRHMVTKKYSRPDNVFCTAHTLPRFDKCAVDHDTQPAKTDHFPIKFTLNMEVQVTDETPRYNFRTADWETFTEHLSEQLARMPRPEQPRTIDEYNHLTDTLTRTLQETIAKTIKKTKPPPDNKRWWTSELENLKKEKNRLSGASYRFRALRDHPAHNLRAAAANRLATAIIKTKRESWSEWLLEANTKDLWTANKYIREPVGD
ncbi:hypothetical protein B0H34DRAFT_660765, partial [Crassisporium funariophilum]